MNENKDLFIKLYMHVIVIGLHIHHKYSIQVMLKSIVKIYLFSVSLHLDK